MNRKAWVSVGLALLLLFTPVAMAGDTISSFHETESELTNASTQTNLDIQGSGDEAEFYFSPPDLREDTVAEFQNGTSSNVTIEGSGTSAVVAYDGFVVGSQHTTDTDFSAADTLDNVTVKGSGDSAYVQYKDGVLKTDGFEDGDTNGWKAQTSDSLTAQQQVVKDGSWAANYSVSGASWDNAITFNDYTIGDNNLTATVWVREDNGDDEHPQIVLFNASNGDQYLLDTSAAQDKLALRKVDGGSKTDLQTTTQTFNYDTWYKIKLEYNPGTGDLTGVAYNSSGGKIATVSATDTGVTPTKVGVGAYRNSPHFDSFKISQGGGSEGGIYISQNHSVTNADEAAINVSIDNGSAAISVKEWTGSSWQEVNSTTVSSSGNYSLDISSASSETLRTNVTFVNGSGDTLGKLHDESILFIEQGEYQSQPREAPEASSAWVDLKLPDTTNATVTVEGYDGSTWTALANKKFTSTGNKSLSIGSGYEKYRTRVNYNRSADGAKAELDDLGYDAVRKGVYVGQNHTLENASQVFLALELHNATANTTVEGYNSSSGSWEDVGGFSTSSSVFDSRNITNSTLDTYRVRLRVSPNSSAANATLTAEGLIAGGGTVVKQVTEETADSTPLLLALSDSPQSEADSIISSLPLTALPDYYQAQITRQIRQLFGFEDSTTAAKEASNVAGFYNNNSGTFTAYINNQISGEEVAIRNYDTIQISFNINGENETVYWLGLVDDGQFATTTIENTTSREVDQTLILSGHLAVKSEEELRTAHESFVTTGETPSEGYVAALKGQYGADASGTLINETAG